MIGARAEIAGKRDRLRRICQHAILTVHVTEGHGAPLVQATQTAQRSSSLVGRVPRRLHARLDRQAVYVDQAMLVEAYPQREARLLRLVEQEVPQAVRDKAVQK